MKNLLIIRKLLAGVLLLCVVHLQAQEKTITGKIIDAATGVPLPGATVNVKGSNLSVPVNTSGGFSVKVPGPDAVLVVSDCWFTTITF